MSTSLLIELKDKIRFSLLANFLVQEKILEDYPDFLLKEEEDVFQIKTIYRFIKKYFTGCKLRLNEKTFSIRLDGELYRKAKKTREMVLDNEEWRSWFSSHHPETFNKIERSSIVFQDLFLIQKKEIGDKTFLRIPKKIDDRHYVLELFKVLKRDCEIEFEIGKLFDEVNRLIDGEIERRKEKERRAIEEEKKLYYEKVMANLFEPINLPEGFESDDTNTEFKLMVKMKEWADQEGLTPLIPQELTYDRVVPIGTKVHVLSPENSREEGWLVVPMFGEYEVPEGYIKQNGWGEVTRHDESHQRARDGKAPIVVQDHIFLEFDFSLWEDVIPQEYFEYAEAYQGFKRELEVRSESAAEVHEAPKEDDLLSHIKKQIDEMKSEG